MRPCFDGKALAPKVIAILHERARQKRLIVDKNKRLLRFVAVDALYALALEKLASWPFPIKRTMTGGSNE
jgi:hypothetical protein